MKYFYVDYPFSSRVDSFDVVCLSIFVCIHGLLLRQSTFLRMARSSSNGRSYRQL